MVLELTLAARQAVEGELRQVVEAAGERRRIAALYAISQGRIVPLHRLLTVALEQLKEPPR